jgi:methylglutaconyl-CoA hydratase
MESNLLSETKSGVARLVLNRPEKRNALTRDLLTQLRDEIVRFAGDPQLRLLVLESSGSAFCAGMDLGEMQQRAADLRADEQWHQDSVIYADVLKGLYALPAPTIAVVQGPALAGGVGLVLACDLVLASDNVFFSLPEPVRGITAAMVTPLLVHRIGAGAANWMLLSGDRVSAPRAAAIGLCHEVVPETKLQERRDQWIRTVLSGSPAALRITKRHLQHCAPADVLRRINESIQVSASARETADAREGLAAFLEKRKPNWQTD